MAGFHSEDALDPAAARFRLKVFRYAPDTLTIPSHITMSVNQAPPMDAEAVYPPAPLPLLTTAGNIGHIIRSGFGSCEQWTLDRSARFYHWRPPPRQTSPTTDRARTHHLPLAGDPGIPAAIYQYALYYFENHKQCEPMRERFQDMGECSRILYQDPSPSYDRYKADGANQDPSLFRPQHLIIGRGVAINRLCHCHCGLEA
ncbi:MAG: hypothetical protein Q9175_002567 [Cornicularia normoerica]